MTEYNTGNAIPSSDVRDLLDNATIEDLLVNGPLPAYPDRLGVSRKSWAGFEDDQAAQLSAFSDEFYAFLAASGFEPDVLSYVDGAPLQVDRPTQLLERASAPGIIYSIKLPSTFPVILSGTWATDEPLLVVRVDGSLRTEIEPILVYGAQNLVDDVNGLISGQQFVTPEQFGAFNETTFIQAIDTGKTVLIGAANTAVTLTTGANVEKLRIAYSRLLVAGDSLTITLPSGQHAMAGQWLAKSANNAKIKLVGAAPVETTISSIASVTGSAGAWVVTANVVSAAGISIGDTVCVKGVTPGVQAPGTYTGRPPIGAVQMQFFQNGSLSLAGQVGTVTGAVLPTYASSGDFLIADGQVKRMLNITASGFTVDADKTPAIDFSGKQYWFSMRPSAAGTVTVSGNTVTGAATTFTTRVNPGDILAVHGYGMRQVVSVDSDTQLTINADGMNVAGASTWGVITPGEMHEGAWQVTNVAGNQVTWTNTARTPYGPPAKLVNGGNVTALKTNLIFSTTSGFVVDGNALDLDKIGIRGSGGSATVAIDLRGDTGDRAGGARLSSKVGVVGFHYGAWLSVGAFLQATSTSFGGQLTRGINVAGGEARIGNASIGGTAGIGVFIGEGAYCRMADARVHGCTLQGMRLEVGGSVWSDFAIVGHNVADNVLAVGGVNVHFVGMRVLGGGATGLTGQNGGYGRATGCLVLGSGYRGFNWNCGKMEANQTIVMGAADGGAVLGSQAEFNFQECAFGYNKLQGIYALTQSKVAATNNTQFVGNGTGIQASALSDVYAPACGFKNNTADATAAAGGRVFINGQAGGATFTPAINTPGADGSLVSDL